MARRTYLLTLAALGCAVMLASGSAAANELDSLTGGRTAAGVEVRGSKTVAGVPGRAQEATSDARPGSQAPVGDPQPDYCTPWFCHYPPEPTAEPAAAGTPGMPAVTIDDVASFAPAPATDAMEPGSRIAVRKVPANFISHASEQVVAGVLLGRPVEVRFTPVGYAWDTGDGGRIESNAPGAAWKSLGQRELTDTATSHRYAERGYYTVRPTVTYAAEYRFDGSGWISVAGTLDVDGTPREIRVVTVETRLTRGTCIEYPNDPGCR